MWMSVLRRLMLAGMTIVAGGLLSATLVRYAPGHNTQEEWVFNAADIDASKVIWAREMTAEQDRPFLEYFHDRQTWLAEPDHNPPLLAPYSTAEAIKEARR